MKFTNQSIAQEKIILANDHYAAIPYDCSNVTADANGIIAAGTVIPSNDGNAMGILLSDVKKAENANGTLVIHGFVRKSKIDSSITKAAVTALTDRGVIVVDEDNQPIAAKTFGVIYDLNEATGTAVTDSSSPYTFGATVTVKAAPVITEYPTGTTQFDEWNTKADGTGTSYAAAATFDITSDIKLYAIYKA